MTAATATRTIRLFASCRDKVCGGRSVIEHPALRSCSNLDITCPACGLSYMTYRQLRGRYDPTKTCDARCEGAKGPNCECACGGERHGIAHS